MHHPVTKKRQGCNPLTPNELKVHISHCSCINYILQYNLNSKYQWNHKKTFKLAVICIVQCANEQTSPIHQFFFAFIVVQNNLTYINFDVLEREPCKSKVRLNSYARKKSQLSIRVGLNNSEVRVKQKFGII